MAEEENPHTDYEDEAQTVVCLSPIIQVRKEACAVQPEGDSWCKCCSSDLVQSNQWCWGGGVLWPPSIPNSSILTILIVGVPLPLPLRIPIASLLLQLHSISLPLLRLKLRPTLCRWPATMEGAIGSSPKLVSGSFLTFPYLIHANKLVFRFRI